MSAHHAHSLMENLLTQWHMIHSESAGRSTYSLKAPARRVGAVCLLFSKMSQNDNAGTHGDER